MARRMGAGPQSRWAGSAFGVEAGLFLAATLAAFGQGSNLAAVPPRLFAVIVLTGLAMGLRSATVRKLAVPDLTTTVLTLTLAGLAADSALAGGKSAGWARRIGSVAAMLGGAALGAWLLGGSITLALSVCGVTSAVCATVASGLLPVRAQLE